MRILDPPESKGPSSQPSTLRRWQQRMLVRVALGYATALVLFALAGLVGLFSLEPWVAVTLGMIAGACVAVSLKGPVSYEPRAATLIALGVLTATLAATEGAADGAIHWILAFTAVIYAGLLAHRLVSALACILLSLLLPLAQSIFGSAASAAGAWLGGLFFLMLSGASLWWVDYGLERIRQALTQRDELVAFVREETAERIAQLEKQQSLERQLRQSQKMEALGTLAGGIAHDFNNLLLVIASGAQSAAAADSVELREILQEIKEAADRGGALTQQLLAFGRRRINERGAIYLNQEVEKSLQMIRRLIPANVALDFRPHPAELTVEATPVDIDQIIMNLCINARDAMPRGGRLTLTTGRFQHEGHLSAEAVITVRDEGMGMNDEQKERAFEPFFTTKRTGAGTGLGLSVVHTIVQNHKGRMELESNVGKGTEFRVYFPLVQAHDEVMVESDRTTHIPQGEMILLVDDDRAVRRGLARVLERAGYDVITAADGDEALKLYQTCERKIDLLITDAVMPNMGGRDLVEAVTRITPDQPCLVCSGYDAGTLDEGFFLDAGREFLAKPFENEQLLRRVSQLLTLRRMSVPPSSIPESARVGSVS